MMPSKTIAPPKGQKETEEELAPLYNVVLLNDEDHTYDYVIEMLQKLFCHSATDAFQHAVEVDTTGRTIVITCGLAEAEFGRDQIHAYGPDPRIERSQGSMRALIELAGQGPRLHENN
jgi:ATP-dependent Clp protease adaptor protein ClpS